MKHIKSFAALLLTLALVLVPFAGVFADEAPAEEQRDQLPLGSADYAITVPAGYTDSGVTDEEYEFGLVAAYTNPVDGLEIDVSRFAVSADGFEAFAKAQAELFAATGFEVTEINGLPAARFDTEWNIDGANYMDKSIVLDAGSEYIILDFCYFSADGDKSAEIEEILATLAPAETEYIRLGSSPYFVTLTKGYYNGEVTPEENASGMVAYYLNDNLLFDFDIYENAAEGTLEEVAQQLCAADKGTDLALQDLNGVPAYTFNGHDIYDGVNYDTVTCVLESTNGTFVAVVCWIDNEPMRLAALNMLSSIKTEDELIPDEPMVLRIGASELSLSLPTTFVQGGVTEEEYEQDGYIGCYYSPYGLFDIDVYQFAVADELPTLAGFTEKDAADYNGTEIALDEQINGVALTSYRSVETYDDIDYQCLTYTFEEDGYYYQVCFYWTDADAAADVEAVMETLAPVEMTSEKIGRTDYSVTLPAGFEKTPVEYEGVDVAAAKYEKDPLTFYVFDLIDTENHYSLEECAAAEVEYYNGTGLTFTEINGIPAAYYYYTRTDELFNTYGVLTYIIENGETGYVDFDFYIDDYVAMCQALDVINSLTK